MEHQVQVETLTTPDIPFELPDYETAWDLNLRANLRLWPIPVPNIQSLVQCAGAPYDEPALLAQLAHAAGGTPPQNTRAVRNTFEVLAYAGLAYRDGAPERLLLTPMGDCIFAFLGTIGGHRFANDANVPLLGSLLIRALSLIVETRVIWMIMRGADNRLTNEELNRSIQAVGRLSEANATIERILEARDANDPTRIGPRAYEDLKYGTDRQNDQRKAINPRFLLAGGGGMFITVTPDTEERRLVDWAVPIVDTCLAEVVDLEHAATRKELALRMSSHAGPPVDIRGL